MSSGAARISYTSNIHGGTTFDLMVDDVRRITKANFHSYEWTKDVSEKRFGERLRAWSKDAAQYVVTITFDGSNREQLLNDFHDALEYDIFNVTPGTLSWEEYSIKCYGIASTTQPAEENAAAATANEVTFYCPSPWWTKVTSFSSYARKDMTDTYVYILSDQSPFWKYWFSLEEGGEPLLPEDGNIYICKSQGEYYNHRFTWDGSNYVDLTPDFIKTYDDAYDYAYDYMVDFDSYVGITNENVLGSSYILTVYGPATNPYVSITNDDEFTEDVNVGINTEVPDGATLTIDSTEKTVYKYLPDGSIENCFGNRNLDAGYLWNRVPFGKNHIAWDGSFQFDLYLVEERSEPQWLSD